MKTITLDNVVIVISNIFVTCVFETGTIYRSIIAKEDIDTTKLQSDVRNIASEEECALYYSWKYISTL